MPEVGVLQLSIEDNSQQAATGLNHLADALERVKKAVDLGAALGNTVAQISKVNEAVQKGITTDGLKRLNNLANVIEKLKGTGSIQIDVKANVDVNRAVENIRDTVQRAAAQASGASGAGQGEAKDQVFSDDLVEQLENGMSKTDMMREKIAILRKELNEGINADKFDDKKIINYAMQIANLEEQYKKLLEIETQNAAPDFVGRYADSLSTIDAYRVKLEALREQLSNAIEKGDWGKEKIADVVLKIQGLEDKIAKLEESVSGGGVSVLSEQAREAADAFLQTHTQVDYLQMKINALREELGQGILGGTMDEKKLSQLAQQIEKLQAQKDRLTESTGNNSMKQEFEESTYAAERCGEAIQEAINADGASATHIEQLGDAIRNAINIEDEIARRKEAIASLQEEYDKLDEATYNAFKADDDSYYELMDKLFEVNDEIDRLNWEIYDLEHGTNYTHINEQLQEMADSTGRMATSAGEFVAAMNGATGATENAAASVSDISEAWGSVASVTQEIHEATVATEEMTDGMKMVASSVGEVNESAGGMNILNDNAREAADAFLQTHTQVDYLQMKIDALRDKLGNGLINGTMDAEKVSQLAQQIEKLRQQQDKLRESTGELGSGMSGLMGDIKNLGGAFRTMFPTLSTFITSMIRISRMRMIRAVVREIAKGISEGVENVYRYSQAIGSSFAPAMDSAAAYLMMMKNSIGAALAPMIQSLIPVLQSVVNWFVSLVNYANQFIALMRGQSTWTRATLNSAKAFDEVKKGATGAKNAIKDLLADWDELNIIQSDSGIAGSGTGTDAMQDYLGMFEEVGKYDNKLRALVDNLKKQFGDIQTTAAEIGAAFLGWKFSTAFTGLLGTLGSLIYLGAAIPLTFQVSTALNGAYFDSNEPGFLVLDTLTALVGGVLANRALQNVLDGTLANIGIPLALGVSAAASIIALIKNTDVKALSEQSILSAMNSALKVGIGAGYGLYRLGGLTAAVSAGMGAGYALYTFGATIGIKATADVMDAREITWDTVLADFISAGSIGAGLAVTSAVIDGTMTAATLAAAGSASLFVFGALIAIQAVIAAHPKKIQWGNYSATQQEIKDFVERRVFVTNANSILNLIDPLVQVVNEKDEALTTTVNEVKLVAQKLTVGFDEEEALNELKKKVFGDGETGGLIGQFKEDAKARKELIETGMVLVPTAGKEGTKGIVDTASEGWKALTEHMDNLGRELSSHLSVAYSDGISDEAKAMELKTVTELTEMMANVSAAIQEGQTYEKTLRTLELNLNNLTRGSWEDMFDYIEEYKKEITSAHEKAYDETTDALSGEARGLKVSMEDAMKLANGDETDATYLAYKAAYDEVEAIVKARREGRKAALDRAAENAMDEETVERIRKILQSVIPKDEVNKDKIGMVSYFQNIAPEAWNTAWGLLFNTDGTQTDDAKEQLSDWLRQMIEGTFTAADAETIQKAIESGILKYSDVIPEDVMNAIREKIGIGTDGAPGSDAWNNLLGEMGIEYVIETGEGMDKPIETPGIDNSATAQGINDTVAMFHNMVTDIGSEMARLDGAGFNFTGGFGNMMTTGKFTVTPVGHALNGGVFRSGDVFTAKENGTPEMIGRFGHQTAVANNQQIVSGISSGVAQANEGVESRLGTIETLLVRMLNKEFVAKAVPSSGWGEHGTRSSEQYSRVTGVY